MIEVCFNLVLAEAHGRLVSEPRTWTLKAHARAYLQLLPCFSPDCLELLSVITLITLYIFDKLMKRMMKYVFNFIN